jgi:hypothetical protein
LLYVLIVAGCEKMLANPMAVNGYGVLSMSGYLAQAVKL